MFPKYSYRSPSNERHALARVLYNDLQFKSNFARNGGRAMMPRASVIWFTVARCKMLTPRLSTRAVLLALAVCFAAQPVLGQAPVQSGLSSPLDELDWLLGDWSADADGAQVRTTCAWDAGRRFLIRHIYVERNGKLLHSVGQRFGYDPVAKSIKVWSFDRDGSHAEGTITPDGANWVFATQGVSSSGATWNSTNTYSEITPKGFTLSSASQGATGPAKTSVLKFTPYTPETPAAAPTDELGSEVSSDPAKQAILDSKEWRTVRHALQEWVSVQKVYSPQELKAMKAQIDSEIAKMTAPELQDFLDDMRDKVNVLLSKEGDDARAWLAQYLAVKVVSKQEWDKMRPDVLNMTSEQLKERLQQLAAQNKQTQQQAEIAAQGRNIQSQAIRQEIQYQRQAHEDALDRAYYDDWGSYRW